MRISTASKARLVSAALAFAAVLGMAGCAGHRFDLANHATDQAFYAANPKCLDNFHPCQSGP
jgi:hypothetical protein